MIRDVEIKDAELCALSRQTIGLHNNSWQIA